MTRELQLLHVTKDFQQLVKSKASDAKSSSARELAALEGLFKWGGGRGGRPWGGANGSVGGRGGACAAAAMDGQGAGSGPGAGGV